MKRKILNVLGFVPFFVVLWGGSYLSDNWEYGYWWSFPAFVSTLLLGLVTFVFAFFNLKGGDDDEND